MSSLELECLKCVRRAVGRTVKIYELIAVVGSETEWAASVAVKDGPDIRFRFTHGQLFNEAQIGDARIT